MIFKKYKNQEKSKVQFFDFFIFIKNIFYKNVVFPYKIKKSIKIFKVQKSKNVNFVNLQNLKKFIF